MVSSMKKIIRQFLMVLLLVALGLYGVAIPQSYAAASAFPSLSIDGKTVSAGEEFNLDLRISDNPGIIGATLEVTFDSRLALTGITEGAAFQALDMTKPGVLTSGCKIHWDATDIQASDIKDGVIAQLTFTASRDMKAGESCIVSVVPVIGTNGKPDVSDINLETVDLQSAKAVITIEDSGTSDPSVPIESQAVEMKCGECVTLEYEHDGGNAYSAVVADGLSVRCDQEDSVTSDGKGELHLKLYGMGESAGKVSVLDERKAVVKEYNVTVKPDAKTLSACAGQYFTDSISLVWAFPSVTAPDGVTLDVRDIESQDVMGFDGSRLGQTHTVTYGAIANTPGIYNVTYKSDGLAFAKRTYRITAHSCSNWNVVERATCEQTGLREGTCKVCGGLVSEQIAALGHSWNAGVITKAATYDAEGIRTFTCVTCKKTRTEKIAKLTRTSLANATISGLKTLTYTGSALKPVPTVKVGSRTLKNGTDYTVSWANNVKAGKATVVVTGKGSYSGSKKATFTINKASLSNASVSGFKTLAYTGKALKPAPVVKMGGRTLKNGTDYTVAYKNNVNAGTGTATITGMGNYTGSIMRTFGIVANTVPMHRLFNRVTGEHFYTASDAELKSLTTGGNARYWKYEGDHWSVPKTSSKPVYRLCNPVTGDHHYTMDVNERNHVLKVLKWRDEGIGWYSEEPSKGQRLFRLNNPRLASGAHHYPVNPAERDQCKRQGWIDEGYAWYVCK